MRELTQEELEQVAGGAACTGFFWYVWSGGEICCGPTLPGAYYQCYDF